LLRKKLDAFRGNIFHVGIICLRRFSRKNESPGRAIPGLHLKTGQVFNAHHLYRRVILKTVEKSEKKERTPKIGIWES